MGNIVALRFSSTAKFSRFFFIVAIYLPPSGAAGVRRTRLDQFFGSLEGNNILW